MPKGITPQIRAWRNPHPRAIFALSHKWSYIPNGPEQISGNGLEMMIALLWNMIP
jgi:hypothetical protein